MADRNDKEVVSCLNVVDRESERVPAIADANGERVIEEMFGIDRIAFLAVMPTIQSELFVEPIPDFDDIPVLDYLPDGPAHVGHHDDAKHRAVSGRGARIQLSTS